MAGGWSFRQSNGSPSGVILPIQRPLTASGDICSDHNLAWQDATDVRLVEARGTAEYSRMQMSDPQQRTMQPQMSTVLGLKSPGERKECVRCSWGRRVPARLALSIRQTEENESAREAGAGVHKRTLGRECGSWGFTLNVKGSEMGTDDYYRK